MHFKSLIKRISRLSARLPWMSQPAEPLSLAQVLRTSDPEQSIATGYLETLYKFADPSVRDYVVSEIDLWKRNTIPNHEFVVAHIKCGETKIGALRMERTVDRSEDGSSAASSRISLTSSSSPVTAKDFITVYAVGELNPAECKLIAKHVVKERVTIAAVIAACSVISFEAPKYQLRTKQCYWFAGLVFRLLAEDSNALKNKNKDGTMRAGEFAKFLQIMQDSTLTEQADEMRPRYMEKLQSVEDALSEHLAKEERLKEAERQVQEAKRQGQEAEREIQEVRRHAEEVERRVQELERRAQELEATNEAYELELRELRKTVSALCHYFARLQLTFRQSAQRAPA